MNCAIQPFTIGSVKAMRVEIELVVLPDAVCWSVTTVVSPVRRWNTSIDAWSRSPSRSLCPVCTSTETLRPRLAKRWRSVIRLERLLPVVWLRLSRSLELSSAPLGVRFDENVWFVARLCWKYRRGCTMIELSESIVHSKRASKRWLRFRLSVFRACP